MSKKKIVIVTGRLDAGMALSGLFEKRNYDTITICFEDPGAISDRTKYASNVIFSDFLDLHKLEELSAFTAEKHEDIVGLIFVPMKLDTTSRRPPQERLEREGEFDWYLQVSVLAQFILIRFLLPQLVDNKGFIVYLQDLFYTLEPLPGEAPLESLKGVFSREDNTRAWKSMLQVLESDFGTKGLFLALIYAFPDNLKLDMEANFIIDCLEAPPEGRPARGNSSYWIPDKSQVENPFTTSKELWKELEISLSSFLPQAKPIQDLSSSFYVKRSPSNKDFDTPDPKLKKVANENSE